MLVQVVFNEINTSQLIYVHILRNKFWQKQFCCSQNAKIAGNKLSQFGLIEDIMSVSNKKRPVMKMIIDPY